MVISMTIGAFGQHKTAQIIARKPIELGCTKDPLDSSPSAQNDYLKGVSKQAFR
jgi:hypothetical protein